MASMQVAEQRGEAATDFLGVTRKVLAACEPFGSLHALQLIHNRRAGRVSCFIELDLPQMHPALARALGATVFGDAVCLDIATDPAPESSSAQISRLPPV
jgi:hypothetical protein